MQKNTKTNLLIAILFVAAILRAPITAVGPITGVIRASLTVSNAVMGLLTTIPLLMFAVFSPLAGSVGVRYGVGRVILLSLICTLLGIVTRSYAGVAGLFIGTMCLGAGTTFSNVLLPSIIKSELPARAGLCTSLFSVTMAVFAAVGSGTSVPLCIGAGWGWQSALAIPGVLVLAAILVWLPNRRLALPPSEAADAGGGSVWRSGPAWWLAGYMAAQACIFYFFVAWLPTIVQARGVTETVSGAMATAYQLSSIAGNLLAPNLLARRRIKKPVLLGIGVLYALGVSLFLFTKSAAVLWPATIICGVSTGACFSTVMLLLALSAESPGRAARLSGMVQSVGYIAAAVIPTLAGYLLDVFGTMRASLAIMLALAVFILLAGGRIANGQRI